MHNRKYLLSALLATSALYGLSATVSMAQAVQASMPTAVEPVQALLSSALPSGGQVVAGQATISTPNSATVLVTQSSSKSIINWNDFSIGNGNTVQFNNGNGSTLNRVTGTSLSSIDGLLSATGSVYLINPNGVIIGKSGVVKVGGSFVASTLDVGDTSYMTDGSLTFSGASTASVINLGQVGALGGDVALMAANVANDGTITAANGSIGLIAGQSVLARDAALDGGKFTVLVGGNDTSAKNTGALEAATIELRAEGGSVYALAGNTDGIIRANGVKASDGRIFLAAGSGGTVTVSNSTLSAQTASGDGGNISLTGKTLQVLSTATLDASATSAMGHGGTVSAIADTTNGSLTFEGAALARGGYTGGDGGYVETSGASVGFIGAKVDTSAANGKTGTWLTDPYDLTIDAAAAATIDTALATTNVVLQTTATGTSGTGTATTGSGDITVNAALNWTSGNSLTLDAYHSVIANADITVAGAGGVVIKTNDGGTGGDYSFNNGASLSFTGAEGSGQSLTVNGSNYNLIYSMSELAGLDQTSGKYALAKSLDASGTTYSAAVVGRFAGTFTGLGHTINGLTINDTADADYVGLFGMLNGTVRDIGLVDGSVTASGADTLVGGLIGFMSHSTILNAYSSGTVTSAGDNTGGLIGTAVNDGLIANSYSTATVTATGDQTKVGGLVGVNGGTIANVYATGAVSALGYGNRVGGLIGQNNPGSITNAYATGSVAAGDAGTAGGLSGYNSGTITNAYATGTVSVGDSAGGVSLAGGLTGYNQALISNAYATGEITGVGSASLGGFVGLNSGAGVIHSSYATGAVISAFTGGGFAGQNAGNLDDVYATGNVAGIGGAFVGGLVGASIQGTISNAHATGSVTVAGAGANGNPGEAGGLIGDSFHDTISQVYATGTVIGADNSSVGGLIGGMFEGSLSDASASGAVTVGASSSGMAANAGGLIGLTRDAVITNVSATGAVTGGDSLSGGQSVNVGGLLGTSQSTLSNATASGTVTGGSSSYVGGLIGVNDSGIASNSSASGAVTGGNSARVGGLAGMNGGQLSTVFATGGATGGTGSFVGGLVGYSTGSVANAYATGVVSGTLAGGLVGWSDTGATLSDSYATGDVTGTDVFGQAGGLVGHNNGDVSSSYATGAVSALGYHAWAGGLIGYSDGNSITDVHASGAVTAGVSGTAGGLIGEMDQGALTGGLATGAVTVGSSGSGTKANAGGLIGTNSNTTVINVNATGAVTGGDQAYIGGLIGDNSGSVETASASGSVAGGDGSYIGGLVGRNAGIVFDTHASGAVTGGNFAFVGGLVGYNGSRIDSSYATGAVTGDDDSAAGGLVGINRDGLITNAFATGAVTTGNGGYGAAGGLAGFNYNATIQNAYATGAVTGGSGIVEVGGLVGFNNSNAIIDSVYATGAVSVSGGSYIGGLVGANASDSVVTNAYYDTQTTGSSVGIGVDDNHQTVTGLTTADLQSGTLPSGFSSSVWSTGNGLYPYLTYFYPTGAQALTGQIVGTTAQISGGQVAFYVDGTALNSGTTSVGANGYYYALVAPGTVDTSNAMGATFTRKGSSDVSAATYTDRLTLNGSAISVNGMFYGNMGAYTSATTLTEVDQRLNATFGTDLATSLANNPNLTVRYVAAAGDFTIDRSLDGDKSWVFGSESGDVMLNTALTLNGSNFLYVDAYNSVNINADINVTGAGTVGIVTADGGAGDYSFNNGSSLTFTGAEGGGQSLTINGDNYNLIYSMAELAATNGSSGNYALAKSLDASSTTYSSAVVGNYAGIFSGLGHTIRGLKINDTTDSDYVGLYGILTGTVRDIGLIGGAINVANFTSTGALVGHNNGGTILNAYATTDISGGDVGNIGGLVGWNAGTITNTYATGALLSGGRAAWTGGLVGWNEGVITNAYATGTVTVGSGRFNESERTAGGGLVAYNEGTITQAYATGAVTGGAEADVGGLVGYNAGTITIAYATGAATDLGAGAIVGGLVGQNNSGTISNVYALGAVKAASYEAIDSITSVGGLVGVNSGTNGSITNAYAAGAVLGGNYSGGLVGYNIGAISSAYWNVETTGTTTGLGQDIRDQTVTGLTTSQLQSGTLPTGFSASVWSTGNGLYPYLTRFYPNGVQAITGYAYASDGTAAAGQQVGLYQSGASLTQGTTSVGANGYYYALVAANTLNSSAALGTSLGGANGASGVTYTDAPSLAGNKVGNLDVNAGTFAIYTHDSLASATLSSLTSTFGANTFATLLAIPVNTKIFADSTYTVDTEFGFNGDFLLQAGGDVTIASNGQIRSGGTGDAIIIAADGSFINQAGASALMAQNGRWLIYTQAHGDATSAATGNSFGGLDGKSYYNDAFNFATSTLASAPNSGNRFVTGYAPTLSVTPNSQSLVYNGAAQTTGYGVTGYVSQADATADSLTGTVSGLTTSSKNVGTYTLTAAGTLVSDENYSLSYGTGTVQITPASLIASLTGSTTKAYDGTTTAGLSASNYSLSGVVSGDSVNLNNPASGSYANKNVGNNLTVTANGLALSGTDAGNYTVNASASGAIGAITPASLIASLTGSTTKTYDGTTTAGLSASNYSLSGVVSGDSVNLNNPASGSYANKNVGNNLTVTANGLALSGTDAGNYTVNGSASGAIGAITPATLIASLTGSTTKTYDGTTTANLTASNYSLLGVVSGDSVNLNKPASGSYANKNVGNNLTVTANGLALSGTDAGNYTVNGSASGAIGAITPRDLTLTASDAEKWFALTDPALTYAITSGSLVSGDSLTGNLTRTTGELPGAYAILQGPVSASGNYRVTYIGGKLTIKPVAMQDRVVSTTVTVPDYSTEWQLPKVNLPIEWMPSSVQCDPKYGCDNRPYPTNFKISSNISFAGQ